MSPAFVWSPIYEADLGGHVFPTEKYRRIRERLLTEGGLSPDAFREAEPADRTVLERVHTRRYVDEFEGLRWTLATASSELPLNPEVVRWFKTAVGGSVATTELALARGAAMHLGGGFHHAFADRAEGFCYLNDIAVAAKIALEGGVDTISVVDVDVHQGNGTARIFQGDSKVFTFSIHQENNYPLKEQSDLDIGLDDGTADDEYMSELDRGLDVSVRQRKPELVFYVGGADPYREDQLGGLGLTLDGMRRRDRLVFETVRGLGAKLVILLAGGYARQLEDTVTIHVQAAQEMLRLWPIDA
jgi:acetoin utilization deacetylase AcuC-like enzyme